MGRYGRYKRKRRGKFKNISFILVAVFIVGFIAISIGVTFYWYFRNSEENKILRDAYMEIQKQINEKKALIEKLKKMREKELEKYRMEKERIMSVPRNERIDQRNATATDF